MNYPEIENVVKHLQKTCKCLQCKGKYELKDIQVIATTKTEGLFETHCQNCKCATIVTVLLAPEVEIKKKKLREKSLQRIHGGISKDDILDVKNFLTNFDGDFKKIFTNKQ